MFKSDPDVDKGNWKYDSIWAAGTKWENRNSSNTVGEVGLKEMEANLNSMIKSDTYSA